MKSALFTNWTNEPFTGYWDGKPQHFAPGQQMLLQDYLAAHYAKHLTNRELLRKKADGTLIFPEGEKMTSPKFPEQAPLFMDLYNKAYTPNEQSKNQDEFQVEGEILNTPKMGRTEGMPSEEVLSPDFNEEDEFGGKPVEKQPIVQTPTQTPPPTVEEEIKAMEKRVRELKKIKKEAEKTAK